MRSERVGTASVWTVDRPEARNAIDARVASELEALVHEAERDPTLRAVVLTGSDERAFLSGADLKLLQSAPPAERAAFDRRMLALLGRLEALPVPVIAAVNGAVVGGGSELLLACDMRIGEAHASVTFKHAAMGLTPGWGGQVRLCRAVRPSAAAKLLFTARPMPADEAREVGLFDEVVPKGQARARALALAEAIAQTSASSVAELKQLLRSGYAGTLTVEEEQRVFVARTAQPDHREALAAYFEKREPAFRARGQG